MPLANHSSARVLAHLAEERPDDVFLTFIDERADYTHQGFLHEVQRWAAAYRRLGLGAGTPVATLLPTSSDGYLAWLGATWLRALEVPINTDHRGGVLAHVLNSSRSGVIVTKARFVERLALIAPELEGDLLVVLLDDEPHPDLPFKTVTRAEFLDDLEPATDLEAPGPADLTSIVYTSGTTGPSKGVMIPWNELSAFSACYPADARGGAFRMYSPWATFHINGKLALAETLDRHGSLVVRERFRTDAFWSDIRAHGANIALVIGGVSNFLWSVPEQPDDADNPLEHLCMAPVIPQYEEFERRFGVKIRTGFGSSEAGQPTAAEHPLPNHRTCGRLLPGWHLRLVDAQGNDVGVNEVGEALVRADDPNWMSHGYLNLPDKTAEAWEGGWFHTGDGLMRDEDGYYYFVDRLKDSIRRRGENISSFEVENEVNAHPDVVESAVVAVTGEDKDDEVLVFVVLHEGRTLDPAELIEFLVPRMPRFMVPRYIEFVPELPKTRGTARTRKVALRERGVSDATWDRVAAGITIAR